MKIKILKTKQVGKIVSGISAAGLFLCVFSGCVSTPTTSYIDPTVDISYITKVAVLPFENHTATKLVEERVRDIASTEVLSRGLFSVVEKGDLERFIREEVAAREYYSLDLATSRRLIPRLKAQAFLAGSVDDFSEVRNGAYSYPVVAITLRLVDSDTGQILWQASGHESGYRTADRLFGFASDDINQVTFKLVARLLETMSGD